MRINLSDSTMSLIDEFLLLDLPKKLHKTFESNCPLRASESLE
jgi:hypothetical protein